jgi:hypothetical protein
MAKPRRPWTVNHPGPLIPRADGLWTVDDDVPGLPGAGRRMSVVRRSDGTLLFFNAIPVPDATLAQILALGTPRALVVPNHLHSLDAGAFVTKLNVTAYVPSPGVELIAERVTCRPISELPVDAALRVFTNEGFRTKEAVLFVREDTLLIADLVTNVPHVASLTGLVMRFVGFTGPEPRLPKPVRKRVETDTAAVRGLLTTLADLPGLARIVPTHGAVVESNAPAALRRIAASL